MRKRLFIAAIAALLLLPVAMVAVLVYTEWGVQLIDGQLGRLERFGVRISGLSGTLAGPLRIERFELNHPRAHVIVRDIVIEPQLRGILLQTLQVGALTARESLVEMHDFTPPPNNRPPRFLPLWLRVDARGVDLAHVHYVHMNGTTVDANHVQGRVTITSRNLRVRQFNVKGEWFDATGNLRMHAAQPMGLAGIVNGKLRMQSTELVFAGQVDGTLDRLAIKGTLQQPNAVSVDALMTRPEGRWRIAGQVVSQQFKLNPWLSKPPFSLRNVDLDVIATPNEIHAQGNVGIPEYDSKDLTIEARGRYANRTLTLTDSQIQLNEMPTTLHTTGTLVFDGAAPTVDLAMRWQSFQWPLRGDAVVTSASGEGTLRGPLPYDFTVNAQVTGPKIPPANGTASGVLTKEDVTFANYALNALDGSLTGSGKLQFAAPRAWNVAARATGVNPGKVLADFPGQINFDARASGEGFDKHASFTATVNDVRGTVRKESLRGHGTVQRDRKGWVVRNANLGFADAQLALDGSLKDTIQANWTLNAPSLQRLLPQASGSIVSKGTASGTFKAPRIVADLKAERVRYQQWLAEKLTVDADIDAAGAAQSRLVISARRLGGGEPLVDTLQLNGAGTAANHRISLQVTGIAPNPREQAPRAEMQIDGRYDQQVWNATITTTHLSTGKIDDKIEVAEPAKVVASRDRAQLDNLCILVGAGRVCANGKWQRNGPWEGTIAGYEIPLALVLPPAQEEAEYSGRIEGRVRAFGAPGKPIQGEAGMRIIDAAIIYRPQGAQPETLNLGNGGLAATATPERVDFSFGVQAFTDTFLYAGAHLLRDGTNNFLRMPLTGDMRARAADANILPLFFPDIDKAVGVLTANADIKGTLAAPEISGRIELQRGELDSYRVNLALRELSLIAEVASNGLDFRGSGRAGDGQLQADGRFSWRNGASHGELHLRGQNLLVADLAEYRVVASPDLRFLVDGRRMDVVGDVTIPSARIQPAKLTGAVRASEDARYVHETPAEESGRVVLHSEVRVIIGDDVRVDAFGLQGRLTGNVGTTVHTGEIPIGRGELNVQEGRYEAYGQKLEINKGALLFEASPLDDPGLDIEARRKIETVTVGLNVRGTLQEPRLTFFSDPTMPQTQIVTYLLTGKSSDSVTGSDTTTMSSAREALALQGGGLLASQIGRRLGLEEVGVESSLDNDGAANTSLVLGKFLSPRLFISYGISLTESINTLKLRYTISDKWIFKTEAGVNQSADLEYTIER